MQFTTLIAFLLGVAVFLGAAFTSAKDPAMFLNAHAALVVFGGTFAAAAISFSFFRLWNLTKVLVRRIFLGHSAFDAQKMIEEIMGLSEIYRNRPDQIGAQVATIKDPFLREAVGLVSDNYLSHEDLLRILMTRTASIFQRYNEDALKFKALAKFPPAFGLMGAVMGMIGAMSELGNSSGASNVGPSLALALIGTLYGVALANLVILPLAENLHDSAREIRSKNMMVTEAIALMLEKKNPILMAEDLNSFLLAHERLDWRTTKKTCTAGCRMKSLDKDFRAQQERFEPQVAADDDDTIWLLSYADLMTLLFTFFVMLYSSAMMDDGKALRKTLASYMQGSGMTNEAAPDNAGPGPGQGVGSGTGTIESIRSSLAERIETEQMLKDVRVEVKNQGLNITFSSNLLFDMGSAQLRADSMDPLVKVIKTLKEKAPEMKVRVEGHTDSVPMKFGLRYRDNWELSGARAAHIVGIFEKNGYPSENLVAVGYGSSRPIAPNRTPAGAADKEGQRRNRRVVLTVYKVTPSAPSEEPK